MNNQQHLIRFYDLLSQLRDGLEGGRLLGDCSGKLAWPRSGVYFFFEAGEFRHQHTDHLRVVRVGTHAVSVGSRTTLWERLRAHRGSGDGRGNHRGSIFRQHVGKAILARSKGLVSQPSWGVGRSASRETCLQETGLERMVSEHLGKMPVLWLSVGDAAGKTSRRAYLEKHSLGLLSSELHPIDFPSSAWLGNHSPEAKIRHSGLWNLNHVNEPYDRTFLDVFAEYVGRTLAEQP